ncbi:MULTISPECIES: cobalt-precorrin-7 (C(5))-methyltransferase [Methanoculleus]|uniref:Precorrin-6Y C5,15-methyltransferase (Decarboxylating) n=1 Tax=Methanoculleus thermophilus TaxID=2200 RepID=A0A1G8ZGB9_9EURY|nr:MULTISPECIES: cobalt-precorrin-7 (C(5))-methyltransferase [Methanoculleus]NLN08943.1 cobalt-precorrin-7 (C(5))-methyltransferase [Methanoculleus thermophilus]SDK14077.1 precorrin-6Y C5,15-methyltransferase (decarboxylating) [Methanoculleus thermophilus]HQD26441.1 cobalt-precorrin-7 (C(5))-methyltransferase [Methanoculleus thermophilus]
MKIVGVGCGPGMLTAEAARIIAGASLIYGSARAIELARDAIPPECEVHEITDYRSLRSLPDHAVVLSTGDPMLAGLGYLPGEVVPGISSLQVAFARLKLPLTRAAIVSAHGKDHIRAVADAKKEVLAGRVVFLIADPAFKVGALAAALPPRIRIAVCEDLGYPAERIAVGTAAEPPTPRGDLFVVVAGDF